MDITPNSSDLREKLSHVPFVRERWRIPAQPHWATRIFTILRSTNPNVPGVVDETITKTRTTVEQGIGQNRQGRIVLTRQEWETATDTIGHVAAAAAIASIAEALSMEAELEASAALPNATGSDN